MFNTFFLTWEQVQGGLLVRSLRVSAWLLLLLLPCVAAGQADDTTVAQREDATAPPPQVAGELELEKAVAERLEQMLQPLVGPTVVLVDLTLGEVPVELAGYIYSQSRSLPGLPVSVSEDVRKLDGSGWNFSEIAGIKIRVFVSEDMSERELDRINELIPLWISLNPSRGDQILIERSPFINPPFTMIQYLYTKRGFWTAILVMGGLILLAALVYSVVSQLTRYRMVESPVGHEAEGGASMSSTDLAQLLGMAMGSGSGGGGQGGVAPGRGGGGGSGGGTGGGGTQFVAGGAGGAGAGGAAEGPTLNLPDGELPVRLVRASDSASQNRGVLSKVSGMPPLLISKLIEGENPDFAALVLTSAKPDIAAQMLLELPEKKRQEVLAYWDLLEKNDADQLNNLIERIRKKHATLGSVAPSLGKAHEKIAEILNKAPDREAQELFAALTNADPAMAKRVRPLVFFVNDILSVDEDLLKRVILRMPNPMVASLVATAPEEVKSVVFSCLSHRAANMVNEEASMRRAKARERVAEAKRVFREMLEQVKETSL